jgi:AGZA family xanthine/uracil permease-like MFS transporter
MGVYANRPFAIAPYMGENAFIAYTVVKVLGYSWQTALGAIFIGGVLFTLLTIFRLRTWLAEAIPQALKYSFAVGIGLFLTFVGLTVSGLIKVGTADAPLKVGQINSAPTMLAIFGFLFIALLMIKKVKGAILLGILATTLLSFPLSISAVPRRLVSLPSLSSLAAISLKLDIPGALNWGFFAVILTVFVMDFLDTMGTLIGVSARGGLLDKDGNLPEIERPMLCDALATMFGALLGTTTTGTFIESAAGIEAGGKTGLTACVTAILFLLSLFFAPLFTAVPAVAYGPALIIVGILMLEPVRNINFRDYTESLPAFGTIVLMSFTFNIGIGITAGFVLYPLTKLVAGKLKDVRPGLWLLTGLSLLFFIFYPYR